MKNCSLFWLFAPLLMSAGIGTIESRGQPLPESPQGTAVTHSIILNSYSTTRQFIRSWTNAETGRLLTRTNQYVELADGLNYLDPFGNWQPSQAEFVRVPGGFNAPFGVQKVFLADNLNNVGAVDMQQDGIRLRSAPLALEYYDPATGQSIVLARLQNTFARQTASNVVEYANAFQEINADVRYTYQKGGCHQDIVMHEAPPPPSAFGLSEWTRLEVLTEFALDTPIPAKTRRFLRREENVLLREAMFEPDSSAFQAQNRPSSLVPFAQCAVRPRLGLPRRC